MFQDMTAERIASLSTAVVEAKAALRLLRTDPYHTHEGELRRALEGVLAALLDAKVRPARSAPRWRLEPFPVDIRIEPKGD